MGISEVLELVNCEDENVEECYVRGFQPIDIDEAPAVPAKVDTSPSGIQARAREIRAAFFNAKSVNEVAQQAAAMHFPVWLDYFIRMSPKEVEVKGQFDIRSLVAQMGPIQK